MKFHKQLYLGASVRNPQRIKRKLRTGIGWLASVYVVAIAPDPDQLEFYDARFLRQKALRRQNPIYIVGLATSYDEALELVEKIVKDCYAQTGTADIKSF
jgi:hypothetical protein